MIKRTTISLALWTGLAAASTSLAQPLSYVLPVDTTVFRPGAGVNAAQNRCASLSFGRLPQFPTTE